MLESERPPSGQRGNAQSVATVTVAGAEANAPPAMLDLAASLAKCEMDSKFNVAAATVRTHQALGHGLCFSESPSCCCHAEANPVAEAQMLASKPLRPLGVAVLNRR